MKHLEDIEAFLAVAQAQGFSQASRKAGVPVSVLSKRLSRLEESLGTRLFNRTTRALQLTEEGRNLLPQFQRWLGDLREIQDQLADSKELQGIVRMTLPWALGQGPVAQILNRFRKTHPRVELHIHFSDTFEKLVEGGFDLAIRFSEMEDSSLIARRLGSNHLKIFASRNYLKQMGTPKTVRDLKDHALMFLPAHRQRRFVKSELTLEDVAIKESIISNNGNFLTELAKAGAGIAIRSHWDVMELLKSKDITEITLNDRLEPGHDAYIVTPSTRYMSKRVRALMDTLVEEFPKLFKAQ